MRTIILASESQYRIELLSRLGLPFQSVAHRFEETQDDTAPYDHVAYLARCKAQSLCGDFPDALIIGSDQITLANGETWLGKPETFERACAQLELMAGGVSELVTATAVLDTQSGEYFEDLIVYQLHVKPLSRAEIETYIRLDQPLDCAGSFRIESRGPLLFDRIEGDDPTGIMGMPLLRLVGLLEKAGVQPLLGSAP